MRLDDFRLGDLRLEFLRLDALRLRLELRLDALREEVFLRGTFEPERRASDSPMAIACLRLVTLFFDLAPLLSAPRFLARMVLATFL